MKVAVAYYPEHWPQHRWEEDAELMRNAGVETIRLGEFSWSVIEPEEGLFDFGLLDRAINLFGHYGIRTILCTPTATYPAWLHRKFPDVHQIKSNGQVKEWGQRQDACKNHPGYRAAAFNITDRIAAEFGRHANVVAWQTDNELGNHDTARCYCENCEQIFQTWLQDRFKGDIEALNNAWGTAFWSQTYRYFTEVSIPRDTADKTGARGQNPGLVLDFYRYSSDVQVQFQRELIQLLRKNSPGTTITHNLMGGFTDIDYYQLARELDVISWNNYPFCELSGKYVAPSSFDHELMRGLKRKNVWIMEQAAGAGGWNVIAPSVEPGRMRLWAYHAIARGADLVNFFRWRTSRFGREQFWHGILDHHGLPGRRYQELCTFASECKAVEREIAGSTLPATCAVLFDFDTLWSYEIQPQAAKDFDYRGFAARIVETVTATGLAVDVIHPMQELSRYRYVFAPSLHVCTDEVADNLTRYVAAGGILVLGPRSGVRDHENGIVNTVLPGNLRHLTGCEVEEYDAFSGIAECSLYLQDSEGNRYRPYGLADVLKPDGGSRTLLTYHGRYYTGRSAVVEYSHGDGRTIYVGTMLDREGLNALLHSVLSEHDLPRSRENCGSVEVITRAKRDLMYRFYLNHSDRLQAVAAVAAGTDILSGACIDRRDNLELAPFGVAVVKEERMR